MNETENLFTKENMLALGGITDFQDLKWEKIVDDQLAMRKRASLPRVSITPILDERSDHVTVRMVFDDIDVYEKFLTVLYMDDEIDVVFPNWTDAVSDAWATHWQKVEDGN